MCYGEYVSQLPNLTTTDITGKRVVIRCDFNVPITHKDKVATIEDDTRITACLETIRFVIKNKPAQVLLCSHLGRPQGTKDPTLSLRPVAEHLSTLLETNVELVEHQNAASRLSTREEEPGRIFLLENLRFDPGEKKNSDQFADFLASLGDVFINEAFSTAHRAHASVVGIAERLQSWAGFHFKKEIAELTSLIENPDRPFVVVIGGAKISDKVSAVRALSEHADAILVGGGTANNFLKAEGINIHKSYLEGPASAAANQSKINYVHEAAEMIDETKADKMLLNGYLPLPKIIMPIDAVAADDPAATTTQVVDLTNNDQAENTKLKNTMYLDIGPKTIQLFQDVILQAATVFWNGPMGMFEEEPFAHGTREIARTIAKSKARTVLGGGDTIAAINEFGLSDRYDYVSAAGGAALDFLGNEKLPGLTVLQRNNNS